MEVTVAEHCECTNATELNALKWLILCEFNLNLEIREPLKMIKGLFQRINLVIMQMML